MTTTDVTPPTAADTATTEIDEQSIGEFAGRLMGMFTSGMLTYMVDIGHRTALFEAAAQGPCTSGELAARAGLEERYVREWLGAMATSGIVDYDGASATYTLPLAHAICLTGTGATNMAPFSQLNTHLAKHVASVATAFREGGGVPYSEYRPEFTGVMDGMGRGMYDALLVDAFVPLVPGLAAQLTAGARVADVACGTGHALVLLAEAFPASTFIGYDLDDQAIDRGRQEAAGRGLTNVTFEMRDAATLHVDDPFDVVFVFDALHDQVDPAGVLAHIHASLEPGGTLIMKEPRVSSNLEDNIGNPAAPLLYSVSTLHCMTVSLAHGGAGLGTAFGEQVARQLIADAGFAEPVVHEAPGDPIDAVYVTSRPR
jgi:SAM-dependent methyltransferase